MLFESKDRVTITSYTFTPSCYFFSHNTHLSLAPIFVAVSSQVPACAVCGNLPCQGRKYFQIVSLSHPAGLQLLLQFITFFFHSSSVWFIFFFFLKGKGFQTEGCWTWDVGMGESGKGHGGKASSPSHADQIGSAFICFVCLNLPVALLNKVLLGKRKKIFENYFSKENNPIVATDGIDRPQSLITLKENPLLNNPYFKDQLKTAGFSRPLHSKVKAFILKIRIWMPREDEWLIQGHIMV